MQFAIFLDDRCLEENFLSFASVLFLRLVVTGHQPFSIFLLQTVWPRNSYERRKFEEINIWFCAFTASSFLLTRTNTVKTTTSSWLCRRRRSAMYQIHDEFDIIVSLLVFVSSVWFHRTVNRPAYERICVQQTIAATHFCRVKLIKSTFS